VIQLAVPNISPLDDKQKALAWAVVSFVATVGGNLTITGSAGK
jgi:Na+/H+ antiporter NhaD/arsenite permease-like protein